MRRKDIVLILDGLLKQNPKTKLHVSVCLNGYYKFYNGTIVNYDNEQSLSFVDKKIGYIIIPFSHIINVEPMIENEK